MDAKLVAKGIVDGLAAVPQGLYLTIVRTAEGSGAFGREMKVRNEYETERFMRAFKDLASNEEPVRKLVTMVISDFYEKLDDAGKKAINDKLHYSDAKLGSRMGANAFISQYIAKRIINRVKMSDIMMRVTRVASAFTLNIVMIQGLIEEAARASRRMQQKYPITYYKVVYMNLDMVYFLVESELEPYLMYIESHPVQCKGIENEICKLLAK
ncbi:hypothetical protein E7W39_00575 [Cronobacter sakazakii]|nr:MULTISPECIES: hypothetical protein [Cronobacter]EAU0361845.1 hypothetical protein [Salmonella enterica]EBM7745723.1 hypothetical protein [Salmonella enterica subsp. enterica serovar Kentucky]MDK1224505.1 hypothetical protein [Cronobacter turicensis]EAZ2237869.1 hypothetical protein [Salmonella enterica]ECU5713565.1 hypothetical protein [Salmonella enterica subsp. enterica serovar Kentucky]